MIIDLVFSLDSIITAVGMVDEIAVMIAAVIVSVALMMAVRRRDRPLRLRRIRRSRCWRSSFLVVVGVVLIADGFDQHVPKGYIYFAMAFSVGVEMLNITMRKRAKRAATRLRTALHGRVDAALRASRDARRVSGRSPWAPAAGSSSTTRRSRARPAR